MLHLYRKLEVGQSVIIAWVISPDTGVPDVQKGTNLNAAIDRFEKRMGRQFWRIGQSMRGLLVKRIK
jgi:hypothetical protein